ncbi:MAG: site-specific integrase [Chloroflexi bacterium]|nr:site-specific integrase [Chloroflexota bacterium]
MARRSNGEGTISQRKPGLWQGSLQVGDQRPTVYGKTRAEVVAKLDALRQQARSTGTLPGRHTLGELMALWLDTGAHHWEPMTLDAYRRDAAKVLAALGDRITLNKLTPARLQALINRHAAHPRAAQRLHDSLRACLGMAVRLDWLLSNPMLKIERPSRRPQRRDWWTPPQCAAFLEETAATRWGPLWAVTLATGMRLGELMGLKWSAVDLERRTVAVERAGQHIGGEWIEKDPKSQAGRRTLPLNAVALGALRRQHAQQAAWRLQAGPTWEARGLVFSTKTGRPLERGAVARALRSAIKKAGLPPLPPHGFRHLNGSLALEAGAPLSQVSKHLGHSNVAITAGIYSHALSNGTVVADAVERALGGSATQGERTHHAQ